MNAWLCGRCGAVSQEDGGNQKEGSLPPEDWREMYVPVRGSEGARSRNTGVICDSCDDSLYEWFNL